MPPPAKTVPTGRAGARVVAAVYGVWKPVGEKPVLRRLPGPTVPYGTRGLQRNRAESFGPALRPISMLLLLLLHF